MRLSLILTLILTSLALAEPTQTISLNGVWEYGWARSENQPPESWSTMTIPGTPDSIMGVVWLRRDVELPALTEGRRVRLHFGMVNHVCEVFVNDVRVGSHGVGFTPFEFDITTAVKSGVNHILVKVQNTQAILAEGNYRVGRGLVEVAKGQKAYMAPLGSNACRGDFWGLYDSVWIEIVPSRSVADLYAIPSVRRKNVSGRLVVRNTAKSEFAGTLRAKILDGDQVVKEFTPVDVKVPADSEQEVSCGTVSAKNLKFWWPINFRPKSVGDSKPQLYHFVVELVDQSGKSIHEERVRFGYRELWVEGSRFNLNGTPLYLLATGAHWTEGSMDPKEFYDLFFLTGARIVRLHSTPRPRTWYDIADEVGVMLKAESAVWGSHQHFALDAPEFWANCRRHFDGWMRSLRNNPSIVLWSISNEMGLDSIGKISDPKMAELYQYARTIDDSRPMDAEADGDLGGVMPIVNLHCWWDYQKPMFPEDNYWVERTPVVKGYRVFSNQSIRGKPLYIGEFSPDYTDNHDQAAIVAGDRAYDQNWDRRHGVYGEITRGRIEGYRWNRVAGIAPWTIFETGGIPSLYSEQHRIAYRPVAVFLRDVEEHFYSNTEVTRRLMILNDSADRLALKLEWSLCRGEEKVLGGVESFDLKPADRQRYDLKLTMPKVAERTGYTLKIELKDDSSTYDTLEKTYWVFPALTVEAWPKNVPVYLIESTGTRVKTALERLGVQVRETLPEAADSGVVVIADDSATGSTVPQLRKFVDRGGVVLMLPQRNAVFPFIPLLGQGPQATTFARATSHPIWQTPWPVENADLRWWQGGLAVCKELLAKPREGTFTVLADGGYGNKGAALLELYSGKGCWLLCQFDLTRKIDTEPMAGEILKRLVRYAVNRKAATLPAIGVLGDGLFVDRISAWSTHFDSLTEITPEAIEKYAAIIVQGKALEGLADVSALKEFVTRGGTLYIQGLSFRAEKTLDSLLPGLHWEPMSGHQVAFHANDPLTDGLNSSDFRWCDDGNDNAITNLYPIARSTVTVPDAKAITTPAVLSVVPMGKGRIVIDQIDWPTTRSAKADRMGAMLLTNIGLRGSIHSPADLAADYFSVDLRGQVNRTLKDDVAHDGKGGWTDQGENDLRNLPTGQQVFRGVPFTIVNRDGGMGIMLAGSSCAVDLPEAVRDIRVGRKAAGLVFLHGCAWGNAPGVSWSYIVHYADNSTAEIPVQYNINVKDWWDVDAGDLPGAQQAWAGPNAFSTVCLFSQSWKNPKPAVAIRSIDIVSQKAAVPFVLAITGRNTWPAEKTTADKAIKFDPPKFSLHAMEKAQVFTAGAVSITVDPKGDLSEWTVEGKTIVRQMTFLPYTNQWIPAATPALTSGWMDWPGGSKLIVTEGKIGYLDVKKYLVLRGDGTVVLTMESQLNRPVSADEFHALRCNFQLDTATLSGGAFNGQPLPTQYQKVIGWGKTGPGLGISFRDAGNVGLDFSMSPGQYTIFDYRQAASDPLPAQWDMPIDLPVNSSAGEKMIFSMKATPVK